MNFDKESKSEKKYILFYRVGVGAAGGRGGGRVLRPKQYARLSNKVKYKKATVYTMESMWYIQLFEIC